jgi:hypothetical protein
VQSWLDVFGGNWAANAPAMSLTVLAIASFVAGLWALLGELGLILVALTMVLIGNPVSRASVRLPSCCPNRPAPSDSSCRRAGGNLLRSTGFFDGIAVGGHAAVFVAWTLAGLVVLLAAGAGHRHLATERAPIRAG